MTQWEARVYAVAARIAAAAGRDEVTEMDMLHAKALLRNGLPC
jgi:hypothetical protein